MPSSHTPAAGRRRQALVVCLAFLGFLLALRVGLAWGPERQQPTRIHQPPGARHVTAERDGVEGGLVSVAAVERDVGAVLPPQTIEQPPSLTEAMVPEESSLLSRLLHCTQPSEDLVGAIGLLSSAERTELLLSLLELEDLTACEKAVLPRLLVLDDVYGLPSEALARLFVALDCRATPLMQINDKDRSWMTPEIMARGIEASGCTPPAEDVGRYYGFWLTGLPSSTAIRKVLGLACSLPEEPRYSGNQISLLQYGPKLPTEGWLPAIVEYLYTEDCSQFAAQTATIGLMYLARERNEPTAQAELRSFVSDFMARGASFRELSALDVVRVRGAMNRIADTLTVLDPCAWEEWEEQIVTLTRHPQAQIRRAAYLHLIRRIGALDRDDPRNGQYRQIVELASQDQDQSVALVVPSELQKLDEAEADRPPK